MKMRFNRAQQKLTGGFLITQVLLGAILFFSTIWYTDIFKYEIAEQIGSYVKRSIVIGDYRSAMLQLDEAIHKHFTRIVFTKEKVNLFSLPPLSIPSESISSNKIVVPVKNGSLCFEYNRFEFIPYALVFQIISCIATLLLLIQLRKNLAARYIEEEKSSRLISIAKATQTLAHDLKGPLGVFEKVANDIELDISSDRDALRSGVARLRSMIESISQAELNNIVRPEKCDLDLCVNIRNIKAHAEIKQILLTSQRGHFPDVHVDLSKVERAISNLLINAIDAAYSEVTINAERKDHRLVIIVKDDGQGVNEDIEQRIFERGFSTKSSSGLGLSFVSHVAAGHGGSVSYSRDKGYTVFSLVLDNAFISEDRSRQPQKDDSGSVKRKIYINLSSFENNKRLGELCARVQMELGLSTTDDVAMIDLCSFAMTDEADIFSDVLVPRGIDTIFFSKNDSVESAYNKIKAKWEYYEGKKINTNS